MYVSGVGWGQWEYMHTCNTLIKKVKIKERSIKRLFQEFRDKGNSIST